MVCEFDESGHITVYPVNEFETPIILQQDNENEFEQMNEIIKLTVNPLIEQIKPFFEQSGLDFQFFNSIKDPNIEIRELKYQSLYSINKPIDIASIKGCVSSAFIIESESKNVVEMRYKRVSNFNKFDSQEAFVIEKLKADYTQIEIIDGLMDNYDDITEEQATDLLVRLANEMQVTRGSNRKRYLEITVNPGFKTHMVLKTSLNSTTNDLIIEINGINNIKYLSTIPVYLDSIIRISLDIKSTTTNLNLINKLCYGDVIEDVKFDDIVATSEETFNINEVPKIHNNGSIIYASNTGIADFDEGQNMDELLDMLGFDDYDSDIEEDIEGGAKPQFDEDDDDIISIKSLQFDTIDDSKTNNLNDYNIQYVDEDVDVDEGH